MCEGEQRWGTEREVSVKKKKALRGCYITRAAAVLDKKHCVAAPPHVFLISELCVVWI